MTPVAIDIYSVATAVDYYYVWISKTAARSTYSSSTRSAVLIVEYCCIFDLSFLAVPWHDTNSGTFVRCSARLAHKALLVETDSSLLRHELAYILGEMVV